MSETEHEFRILRKGERLQPGDEYQDPHNGKWYPTKTPGTAVGVPNKSDLTYRRYEVKR